MHPVLPAALLALLAGAATAQTLPAPPAEREPNPAVVRERERALGIAPTPGQDRREDATLNQLLQQLTGQPPGVSPPAPPATQPSGTPSR
jgi:hypothetical protein